MVLALKSDFRRYMAETWPKLPETLSIQSKNQYEFM